MDTDARIVEAGLKNDMKNNLKYDMKNDLETGNADVIAGLKADLRPVRSESDIAGLVPLVRAIWREVFPPIIGEAQTEYMLEHYQSAESIGREIAGGARYFRVERGGAPIGYLAYEIREDWLFVSKVYLAAAERGKGISSELFAYLERQAEKAGKDRLHLHVNRRNEQAIAVYRHRGFEVAQAVVTDIGGGFAMDDYHMEKALGSEL